jgi:hypothetical protein
MAITVQQAVEAATRQNSPEVWLPLTPAQRTRAIYQKMRRMNVDAPRPEAKDRASDVN